MTTNTNALYALRMEGNNENGYLLWLRGGTLVAQDFDTATLKLGGELHPVANPVSKMPVSGQMQVAVSATGILLYSASNPSSQYMWLDRAGKPLRTVGEPTDIGFFRLAPDGRRVVGSLAVAVDT